MDRWRGRRRLRLRRRLLRAPGHSKWDQRNKACANVCTGEARSAGDDANRDATISDIAFGAGLAAVGVGTYLILTSHGSSHPSGSATFHVAPVAFREGAALLLRGDF